MVTLALGKTRTTIVRQYRVPSTGLPMIVSGNSGSDPIFHGGATYPGLVHVVNEVLGVVPDIGKSTIPGSSWSYRWDNPTATPDARIDIGDYAILHICNNSNVFNANQNHDAEIAKGNDWAQLAWTSGNGGLGAETLWWPTWARQDAASVAADYAEKLVAWERVQDYCNDRMPLGRKPSRIVPSHLVFQRMFEDQAAQLTPTATWYDDLFLTDDPFHLGDLGSYIIIGLNAACVYGIDPADLPASVPGLDAPTAPEVEYIRSVIKDVVSGYPRSGADTSGWA